MSKQKEFRLIRLLVVVVVLFVCIGCGTAGDESKQISCIVIPAQATEAEQHAANELARYINKMTGQKVSKIAEGDARNNGRAIILREWKK